VLRMLVLPFRAGVGAGRLGFVAGWRAGRFVGPERLVLVGAGVAVGLLVAPVPGRVLRERARRAVAERGQAPGSLAERVAEALRSDPRTGQLVQPEVEVTGRRVVLRGTVPHETARGDLGRVAGAVPGVAAVDNLLQLPGTGTPR
jgi:BON domain